MLGTKFQLGLIFLLFAFSCEKINLSTNINSSQISADDIEIGLFMNNIQLSFNDFFLNASSRTQDVVRMEAMTSGSNYNEAYQDSSFNELWKIAFADLLPDLEVIIKISEIEDKSIPIFSGMAKLMKAYALITMVDMFGNIPYSQALMGPAYRSPKVDNQEEIYKVAFELIEESILEFNKPSPYIGENDFYYNG